MKYLLANLFFILFIFLIAGCTSTSEPHPITLSSNGTRFTKPIKTWKDILEQNIVMQKFDYSCGAGAMATLMRYYFQDEITEKEVLEDIMNNLDKADIQKRKKDGFSVLDLKQFAERRGYKALGVKLKLSALPKLRGPILVHLETVDYRHFVVLRGMKEDHIFLADPGRGNLRMSVEEFSKEWSGIALILGKKGFGTLTEYPLKIREEELLRNELNVVRNRGLYRRF